MKPNETIRLVPPVEMFENCEKKVPLHEIRDGDISGLTIKIECPEEGGVLSWQRGFKYPVKGWTFTEALYAIDCVKRAAINSVKFATSKPIRYFLPLFLFVPRSLKRKIIRNALIQFTNFTEIVFMRWGEIMKMTDENDVEFGIDGVFWKDKYFCDMVREFRRVALKIAGDDKVNRELVLAISMVLEFDGAYRYRLQDGFGEIDIEKLKKNPSKELCRVIKLIAERGDVTKSKFELLGMAVKLLLLSRDVKNIVNEFFNEVDLNKLCLDEIDFYRCCAWGGHKFCGIPDEQRAMIKAMIDDEWKYKEKVEQK